MINVEKENDEYTYQQIQSVLNEFQRLTKIYNALLKRTLENGFDENSRVSREVKPIYGIDIQNQQYYFSKQSKFRGHDYQSLALTIAALLKGSGCPMSTKQLYEALVERGFTLTRSNFSNNIMHKIIKGSRINVERAYRGYWQYRLK